MLSTVLASYPRRQQIRRLMRAGRHAVGAVIALTAAAVPLASADHAMLALALGLVAVALGLRSRRALRLAGRSRVGAESEAQVRRLLEPLTREGWHVRHAVNWPGAGDLDHVVRSPAGMGFVIETKTLRYTRAHRVRTADAARWLARRRRHYPLGVFPVICVTRARSVERIGGPVLVVSLDRLMPALHQAAGSRPRRPWSMRRPHERERADRRAHAASG